THPTTVTGNGGLNVININGSVHNSLTLSGTASDVFVVNITGNVDLIGSAALGLAGGVTAGHVLYNVTGHGGIDILSRNAQDGTLLAPNGDVLVDGTFNGELIGGRSVTVLPGATVNPAPFSIPSPPTASLSGFVISGNTPLAGVTVVLTGVDNQSNAVNLSATTDATGAYSFTALQPGTYTIEVPQVPGDTFTASVGSVAGSFGDGTVDPAGDITGIVLTAGQSGTDFDFTAAAHIISA
ncbi:MAG: SdrD B-like domain-containing protein, partial [Mycobacterium sp.]|nr:SdrD B-like domain-containing protein [Mycobacterium sp.]